MTLATTLDNAMDACPFDSLGWFEIKGKWLVRCWHPGATQVTLLNKFSGEPIGDMECVDEKGLFEFSWPKKTKRCTLDFHITRTDCEYRICDSYQFADRTFEDFDHDHNHLFKNMGAQLCEATGPDGKKVKGVRFAVYAPNARAVSVIGSFNDWDGRRHLLNSGADGVWRLFVPGISAGDQYKFELKDQGGTMLPHKSDPYGFFKEQYPSFASIVFDHEQYQWQDKKWRDRALPDWRQVPINIYEVHAGSWRQADGQPLGWTGLTEQLIPYVVDMGYTHIELLPVSEYPFDGSWGYQPVGLFAPTSRFGTPDEFKAFVDACHQANIGVIVDWVPAHFPADEHGLAKFDGTALYEYSDPRRGWHPDWNSYIYDYGRHTVCDFLISSAVAWLEYFHIDGIRVDAVASMLYLDYSRESGEWVPNVDGGNHNYEAIEFVKRFNETVYSLHPKVITIAEESTSFDGVTRPVFAGGLGFGFKWNMGWMHDSLQYLQHDPIHRRYHHGEITFSMVYAYSENYVLPLSHDEVVHGKGSIIGRMPGDEWQQVANLRAFYGYMFCHPGKKLNFMGNEFGQGAEWSHTRSLDWHLLQYEKHSGVQSMFKDLNHLYANEKALHQLDCDPEGFTWLNHDDADSSVISFARFSPGREEILIVVTNFTPVPHEFYRIGVPESGYYEVIFNTDAGVYNGSNFDMGAGFNSFNESRNGQSFSVEVRLPPLATVVMKKKLN